jgi:uncharacterized protein involved in outer membrane biogenesis
MAGTLRKVALWALGLLLLSATVIVAFLAIAGDGFYRWAATQLLENALDRQVHVDGTFSFDVGLEPSLMVTDVWVENAPWAEKDEMARVERVEVQIVLKPLFSGIVQVPRLVVEGLTLELERGPDGAGNWQMAKAGGKGGEAAGQKVSLKDVAITYRDRQSGRDTVVLLRSLQKDRLAADSSFAIQGEGHLNQSAFRIKGRFGSLEDALAATAPYPLALTFDTSGLVAELKGTAQNLPQAEGFDMSFSARAPSIGQVLEIWESDLALEGRAEASARLKGNLESLSVEDFVLEVVEHSGQELQVKGSLSDLLSGGGLDLRFTGKLGPESLRPSHTLPKVLQDIAGGVARLDIVGRITGDLKAPAFEKLHAQLEHRSGGVLSLQGQVSLDLSGGGSALTGLETTSILSLPGPALLEQALGTELPDLGALHATSELSWKEGWITLSSFKAEAESISGLRLNAEGRIGKYLNNELDFDPQLALSASIENSRQLVPLIVGLSKEARPPLNGSGDHLVLSIQRGLKSLGLHPGPADGKMGPHTRSAIKVYQAKHGLSVDGRATEQLLHYLQQERDSPRQRAARDPDDLRSQTSKLEDSMPELGSVRARAALRERGGLLALTGIDVSAGPPDKPTAHITGEIGDLLAMKQLKLNGTFEMEIASLLGPDAAIKESELGKLRGELDLSDADGSLGIESLHAEALDTKLLTLSIQGKFDDITQRDDLRFETSLKVPSLSALGRELGFEVGRLGVFTFTGHVSGSDDKLLAEGKARLGQTDFSGTLSGSLVGERPILYGKLYSPVFHFADFGLLPETDAEKVDQETEKAQQRLFSGDPISFEMFRAFDLNLDVILDQLEGVELNIDKAEAQLNLKDGVLKIEPLRFVFVGGRVAAHLVADAHATDPRIGLRLEADDVDLGDLLAQVKVAVPLDGELDMVLDLKAAGASPRALASSLEGDWDMAISRGHVRTSLLDLAAIDLVHWMISDSARKGYSDLNCLIVRFDFRHGVAESKKLILLDTTNVLALGEGSIDLRDEIIDIKFKPHAKNRRLIETTIPFAIEGPLASPSVKVSSTRATARMVEDVLLTPVRLLGDLLPFVHDHGKDPNNPCLIRQAATQSR